LKPFKKKKKQAGSKQRKTEDGGRQSIEHRMKIIIGSTQNKGASVCKMRMGIRSLLPASKLAAARTESEESHANKDRGRHLTSYSAPDTQAPTHYNRKHGIEALAGMPQLGGLDISGRQ
jgi:hypothetical protein